MKAKSPDPPGFVKDPFQGDSFVMAKTLCTRERRLFLKRSKEITSFLMTTEHALKLCCSKLQQDMAKGTLQPNTPFRIKSSDGRSVIMTASSGVDRYHEGQDILRRQIFVMHYGSFETYLFQILERAFPDTGVDDEILKRSIGILHKTKWDGKFCRMREVFGLDYKKRELIDSFKDFQMKLNYEAYQDPLRFLDELAHLRHRIVHASSILHGKHLISIPAAILYSLFVFYARLTDYLDDLFAKKFGYSRQLIDPAKA